MNDTRRQDPLKRTPPTIDLEAEVMPGKDQKGAEARNAGTGAPEPASPAKDAPGAKAGETAKPVEASKAAATGKEASVSSGRPGDASKPAGTSEASATETPRKDEAAGGALPKSGANPPEAKAVDPKTEAKAADPKATTGPEAAPAKAPGEAKTSVPNTAPAAGKPAPSPGTKPATATATASRPADPPPERIGAGTVLVAGLFGGLLGALLSVAVMQFLAQDRSAEDRIAAIERRLSAPPAGLGQFEPRVSTLEAGVRQATETAAAAARQAAEALARPAGAQGPDQEARNGLRSLSTRIDESTARATQNTAALGELGQKLDGLGRSTSERFASAAKDAETFATHQKSLQADTALLRTSAAALEGRTSEADKRIAALTDGLGRVTSDLARVSPAALQAGLRIIVSGRLDDALRAGAPLAAPISALTKLGTDPAALAPLRPYADTAAPNAALLLAEFRPLATAMTAEPARQDESWLDKGRRALGKVVTVRDIGDGSGEDVPGLISRIETGLGRGAAAEAKAAWDRLPEDKRKLSAAWGEKLGTRVAAEEAVRRISAQSLSALDAATR